MFKAVPVVTVVVTMGLIKSQSRAGIALFR